jgi:hypothetical protein
MKGWIHRVSEHLDWPGCAVTFVIAYQYSVSSDYANLFAILARRLTAVVEVAMVKLFAQI